MLKILFISGSYPPIKCGVGDYTKILCEKLSDKMEVSVITSKKAEVLDNSNVKIINSISKWKGLSLVKTIMKEIKNNKYDIVHIQFPTSEYVRSSISNYFLLPFILRLKRIKYVYTLHEYSNNSRLSKFLRKPAIYFSNKIIVVDEAFKSDIKKRNKFINKSKIEFINIGSNIPKSVATEEEITILRQMVLKEKLLSDETKIISYFGFINESKCMNILLQALADLKKNNQLSTLLLIIGDFNSEKCQQDLFNELKSIITENNLENNIYITGFVDNYKVGDYFRISDAAVLMFKNGVSVRNGSMLAAQQEGIQIITTKPSLSNDYFKSDQFILIDNNAEQVKNVIINLQSGLSARYSVDDSDQWENIALKHLEIYNDLVSKKN